jgi:hypothetical protein
MTNQESHKLFHLLLNSAVGEGREGTPPEVNSRENPLNPASQGGKATTHPARTEATILQRSSNTRRCRNAPC